ncbi:oligosaccharide flippase family protein [Vibrio kanaloae]|uniref:oligosaccharide flippase family protein n=1 Tax=Vibrio kanaloae TaxID=170673 RepID=UPI00148D00A3|nr:oligosaccharide flippase family protein [Vibrio kanaloae]NOI03222.1 oligosaccharide flippase family protein [Vibrio kanaloae]
MVSGKKNKTSVHRKEIWSNIFSFGVIDIIGLLIPLITMPILTRALGKESYGVLLLINVIVFFGHTIVDYGMQFTGVRELANSRSCNHKVKIIYEENQGVRFFFLLVYCTLSICYAAIFQSAGFVYYVLIGVVPYLLGYTLLSAWFFQGIGKTATLAKLTFTSKLINLFVIVFFVSEPSDIRLAIFALSLPMLICGIFSLIFVYANYSTKILIINNFRKRLKIGFDVFIGLLAPNLYNAIPTIVLGAMFSASDFAPFGVASRLSSVISTIQNVIAKSVFPVIAMTKINHLKDLILINISISIPIAIIIFIFGVDLIVIFLGNEYSNSYVYLKILVVGLVFSGIANSFSQGYFLPNGFDEIYRSVALRVSVFSGVISFLMISNLGLLGGCIAITLARMIFSIDYFVSYKRLK